MIDYFEVLGVPRDSTEQEIKKQYRTLIKKYHTDTLEGRKARAEKEGDDVLVEILESTLENYREKSKEINLAYEILSDATKRHNHLRELREYEAGLAADPPEIVIRPTNIDLGILKVGEEARASFTIDSVGGSITNLHIDWENGEPEWGELLIETDPINTFPIKVIVVVNGTGSLNGNLMEEIVVEVE